MGIKEIKESVFKIITPSGSGSGFAMRDFGYIITNAHVVENFKKVAVENSNKRRFSAKVVMINIKEDLAFLSSGTISEIESPIVIDKDLEVEDLSRVNIYGYPFGMPFTATRGVISSASQQLGEQSFVQTDAAINPGNSGGPMVDDKFRLIGVASSKFNNADNVGFAIKYDVLRKETEDFDFNDGEYRIKCSNCDNYIVKKSRYCEVCGSSIESTLFQERNESYLESFVNELLPAVGIDPVLAHSGEDFWEFYHERNLLRIFRSKDYIFATSPLNILPEKKLEDVLEYIVSYSDPIFMLGVYKNTIYLSYRIHSMEIYSKEHKGQIRENFIRFIRESLNFARLFHEEYKAPWSSESREYP